MTSLHGRNVGFEVGTLALGVAGADFDRIVDPARMVGNPRRDLGLPARPTG